MAQQASDLSGDRSTAASTRVLSDATGNRIITHVSPDADSLLSVEAVRRYVPGYADAEIVFVDANFDGQGLRDSDFAVDIKAGGKGFKGSHDLSGVGSAYQFILDNYAPDDHRRIMDSLSTIIDIDDSYGNAVYHLTPEGLKNKVFRMLSATSFCSTLGAAKIKLATDERILAFTASLYEGLLELGRQKFGLDPQGNASEAIAGITLNAAACVWAHGRYAAADKPWPIEARAGSIPFRTVMEKYTPAKDQLALEAIIDFVEMHSAEGDGLFFKKEYGLSEETAEQLAETSLAAIFCALKTQAPHALVLLQMMGNIFDGFLANGKNRLRALELIKTHRVKVWYYGKIALVNNTGCPSLNAVLFERGVQAIVYINKNNIGVVRNSFFRGKAKFSANDPALLAVIKAAGEEGQWFEHPSGFLLCWGSSKSVKKVKSKVNPMHLIHALIGLFKSKNLFIGASK